MYRDNRSESSSASVIALAVCVYTYTFQALPLVSSRRFGGLAKRRNMSQPPPNIRRTTSRSYDIHNPEDLNALARKLSRRRSRRSTGASRYTPYTPGAEQAQYGFPESAQTYTEEPVQIGHGADVNLATPLGIPRLKSYRQDGGPDYTGTGEELGPTTSRRSRASQRPGQESVREDDEESGSDDDDDDSTLSPAYSL